MNNICQQLVNININNAYVQYVLFVNQAIHLITPKVAISICKITVT